MGAIFGAFFELIIILLKGFFNLGAVLFVEFIKGLYELALDNMHVTVPILLVISLVIIARICMAISDRLSTRKTSYETSKVRATTSPIIYSSCSYDYDDDDDDDDEREANDLMADVYRSEMGLFGDEVYYDKYGNKIGYAECGILGDKVYYDKNGTKVMRDECSLLGDRKYYDMSYRLVGRSESGLLGDKKIYDSQGNLVGKADTGLFGDKKYYKK